jgi:hypothetical protein
MTSPCAVIIGFFAPALDKKPVTGCRDPANGCSRPVRIKVKLKNVASQYHIHESLINS